MLAAVQSAAVLGVDAFDVTVEVDCTRGLPQWTIVGMAATSVKESRERVCAALANAGIDIPPRRTTVNLAPSDIAKTGTAFDLPIAVAFLVAIGIVPAERVSHALFLGELGLDGAVRPVRGALSVARLLAQRNGGRTLVLPKPNVGEAALVRNLPLCAPETIAQLLEWLRKGELPVASWAEPARADVDRRTFPMSSVRRPRSARSRSRPPEDTTSFSSALPVPARRCWRAGCRPSCRPSAKRRSSR